MKSVTIADLKAHLSSYLGKVVEGQEIIVRNRKKPVARIVPIVPDSGTDNESILASQGKLRLPAHRRRNWPLES